jgi:hypothetical protein
MAERMGRPINTTSTTDGVTDGRIPNPRDLPWVEGALIIHTAVQPERPSTGRVAAVAAIVVAIGFVALRAIQEDLPSNVELAEQVERLETALLPVVEGLQVEYFIDEPGCANLTYPRGDSIDGAPDSCGGSTSRPVPFDDIARADHERIRLALEASQTPIERVGGRFFSDGRISSVWFVSNYGAPLRDIVVSGVRPGGPPLGRHGGNGHTHARRGTGDWWFACCAD